MTARLCPICSKPTRPEFRPFCSARCADVDLHRWLAGLYAIGRTTSDDDEPEENAPGEES